MNRMIGVGEDFYFFNQPFQPVFKFALHAGAGLQQREIEAAHRDVLAAAEGRRPARCAVRILPPPLFFRRPLPR